jgi:hypothetical protein
MSLGAPGVHMDLFRTDAAGTLNLVPPTMPAGWDSPSGIPYSQRATVGTGPTSGSGPAVRYTPGWDSPSGIPYAARATFGTGPTSGSGMGLPPLPKPSLSSAAAAAATAAGAALRAEAKRKADAAARQKARSGRQSSAYKPPKAQPTTKAQESKERRDRYI